MHKAHANSLKVLALCFRYGTRASSASGAFLYTEGEIKMTYYVDTAKYQPNDLSTYKKAGASGAIVQITVGSSIKAPKGGHQIHSAHLLGLHRLFYHYACFGHSVNQAVKEAKFACKTAKSYGYKTIHIFCDWEGQDNDTSGSVSQNTEAILAFMREIRKEGFTPGLYSSASLLRTKINIKPIIKEFGTCLWVASYPYAGATNDADMRYFPSMDGVCLWQFTDNWRGLNVDCSKVVYDPFKLKKKTNPKVTKVTRETYEITGENIKIKKV